MHGINSGSAVWSQTCMVHIVHVAQHVQMMHVCCDHDDVHEVAVLRVYQMDVVCVPARAMEEFGSIQVELEGNITYATSTTAA